MSLTQNQTMIITGASRGIARALALELAGRGINLVLNARSPDLIEEVAEQCLDMGVKTAAVAGNAASEETCGAMVEAAIEIGDFYGFVHAAAVLKPGPLVSELSAEDFDAVFDQIRAAHRLTRAAFPILIERGGGLAVYVGSGAAEIAQPGIGAYCAAKAAMHHLMRNIAAEHKQLVCMAYHPGIVETLMQQQAREAVGGGAAILRNVFTSWKEKGWLITPEKSAKTLADVLMGHPEIYHGRVASIDELL